MALCEANFFRFHMKNLVIDKQRVQFPNQNKTKKTQLEIQIAELQNQEQQIQKQLKLWESKRKKAHNLANCLQTADKFGKQFLNEALEKEKNQEQPDNYWLEHLLKNKVEFAFKFEFGTETFTKLISESVERQHRACQTKLENIQNQLHHQERKFARLQARRQGKTLLECEYRQNLGCFGEDWCDNCQTNYSTPENEPLKGGAY